MPSTITGTAVDRDAPSGDDLRQPSGAVPAGARYGTPLSGEPPSPPATTSKARPSPYGIPQRNKVQGNERASNVHGTKAEAQAEGRGMARDRKVEHTIKKQDGTMGEKNSYGNDPRKSKG